jgi:hypothetical protein
MDLRNVGLFSTGYAALYPTAVRTHAMQITNGLFNDAVGKSHYMS